MIKRKEIIVWIKRLEVEVNMEKVQNMMIIDHLNPQTLIIILKLNIQDNKNKKEDQIDTNKNIQKDVKTQTQTQEQIPTQEINVKITESSENSLS